MTTTLNPYRITEIDPAEWSILGYFYQGPSEDMQDAYRSDHKELWDELEKLGLDPTDAKQHANGGCAHCGAHFSHGAMVRNTRTGDVIAIGHTCAYERFSLNTKGELRDKYGAVKLQRERDKAARLFAELLAANEGLEQALECPHFIVRDIRFQAVKKGILSEKQIALVLKLAREHAERIVREEAERGRPAEPCPAGRVVITGRIIKLTEKHDDRFGTTLKCTVKDDRGFMVWGTLPDIGAGTVTYAHGDPQLVNREMRITFTATVTVSDKDPMFGFYKRPAKSSVIS